MTSAGVSSSAAASRLLQSFKVTGKPLLPAARKRPLRSCQRLGDLGAVNAYTAGAELRQSSSQGLSAASTFSRSRARVPGSRRREHRLPARTGPGAAATAERVIPGPGSPGQLPPAAARYTGRLRPRPIPEGSGSWTLRRPASFPRTGRRDRRAPAQSPACWLARNPAVPDTALLGPKRRCGVHDLAQQVTRPLALGLLFSPPRPCVGPEQWRLAHH